MVEGLDSAASVERYDLSGNLISSFSNNGERAGAMTFTGSEVWIGDGFYDGSGTGQVNRYDLSGNSVGSFNNGTSARSITFTGSEVWVGEGIGGLNGGLINRYDLSGNNVGSFNNGTLTGSMIFTGSEVWIGTTALEDPSTVSIAETGTVSRYDISGNSIGTFTTAYAIWSMTRAGSEVWMSLIDGDPVSNSSGVFRYDQSGNLLGQLDADSLFADGAPRLPPPVGMTSTGSEVRISGNYPFGPHTSWDLSGNFLNNEAGPIGQYMSMVFVPEPNTSVLFSLGLIGLAMIRRSLKGF